MSPQQERARNDIYDFLNETSYIYNLIKKFSILAEELLPEHKAPIHAANELKSLVFHLYNAVNFPDEIGTNILEAKEHLCRAFYDLHGMVISIYIGQIKNKLSPYKITTISNAFPEYGSVIRPTIREIQEVLREKRTNRNTDIVPLTSGIGVFEDQIKRLARFEDIVESYLPDLNKYEKEARKNSIGRKVWDILKIIITVVLTAVITYYLTIKQNKHEEKNNNNQEQHQKGKDSIP